MKMAYMIIAHGQFELLSKLIVLLDDPQNDLFLHIDQKATNFDFEAFAAIPQYSKITFVERVSVNWGGYSLVQAELNLLEAATAGSYDYYHLLSGVDLPIKSNREIERFFEENRGTNFIQFESGTPNDPLYEERYLYRYPFEGGLRASLAKKIVNRLCKALQRYGHIERKRLFDVYKGANWFSITDDLAQYCVQNKELVKEQFGKGLCPDELFIQSMVMRSPYRDSLREDAFRDTPESMARAIDWKRGSPYVYRSEDFEELLASNCLWARKFDLTVDKGIVEKLYAYLRNKNCE